MRVQRMTIIGKYGMVFIWTWLQPRELCEERNEAHEEDGWRRWRDGGDSEVAAVFELHEKPVRRRSRSVEQIANRAKLTHCLQDTHSSIDGAWSSANLNRWEIDLSTLIMFNLSGQIYTFESLSHRICTEIPSILVQFKFELINLSRDTNSIARRSYIKI